MTTVAQGVVTIKVKQGLLKVSVSDFANAHAHAHAAEKRKQH
jgi:hypothetical protein